MATIKLENGKWIVRAIGSLGEDCELAFSTHIEAQAIANVETKNQLTYFSDFRIIDGRNQHPSGLNFREWLKAGSQ